MKEDDMKPYCKTFRASKIHKASECGYCSEKTESDRTHPRNEAKKGIEKDITEYCDEDNRMINTICNKP